MKWRCLLLIIAFIALIGAGIFLISGENSPATSQNATTSLTLPQTQSPRLSVNDHIIYLDISDTPEKRTQGLSGRDSMPQDHGMLFIFDSPQKPQFWMYEMKFPLDFVWINGNKVVQLNENIPAPLTGESPAVIRPDYPVDKVLEVNAGFIKSAAIKIGDEVKINL